MKDTAETNKLFLAGEVVSAPEFYHEAYDEKFFSFNLRVPRLSETDDLIPVLVSEKIMDDIVIGNILSIDGQLRTYSRYDTNKRRLLMFAFVRETTVITPEELQALDSTNVVTLTGKVCKVPGLRRTPRGREVCDMHISVSRAFKKSDFIPVIAWGRNAKYCSKLAVDTFVEMTGRLQAREYTKKGSSDTKTAYELSISHVKAVQEPAAV